MKLGSHEEVTLTCVYIFDNVIRKTVKIAERESSVKGRTAYADDKTLLKQFRDHAAAEEAQKQALQDIEKIWQFAHGAVMKIREEQMSVLSRLVARKPEYQETLDTFEEFYKSRLEHVLEGSLNYLELKKMLDDVTDHDAEIRLSELQAIIAAIFKEHTTKELVYKHAL